MSLVRIFTGRNSPRTITVKYEGAPMDFIDMGVTKLGLVIGGKEITSDTAFLSFANGGVVTLKLGALPNPPIDAVVCRLVMYTPQYADGFVLISEYSPEKLILHFT